MKSSRINVNEKNVESLEKFFISKNKMNQKILIESSLNINVE